MVTFLVEEKPEMTHVVLTGRNAKDELIEAVRQGNEILWYHEGIHAPIAVVHNDDKGTALRISGKVEDAVETATKLIHS